jgi:glycosyltransferase involved in cell wall biosynthesis
MRFPVDRSTIHILMPTWGHSATIDSTMNSISMSTDPRWICDIFVDSEDEKSDAEYLKLCKKWEMRDSRYRWTFSSERKGCGTARNKLLYLSSRHYPQIELCAIADSDDIYIPERLAIQRKYLIEHPDCDFVSSEMKVLYCDHRIEHVKNKHLTREEQHHALRNNENPLANPTVMFRREALLKFGGYAAEVCEDLDLWKRMYEAGMSVDVIQEPLVIYRGSHCKDESIIAPHVKLRNAPQPRKIHLVSGYFPLSGYPSTYRSYSDYIASGTRLMNLPVQKTIWFPEVEGDVIGETLKIGGNSYPSSMFRFDDPEKFWAKEMVRMEEEDGKEVEVSCNMLGKDTLDYHALQHQKTTWLAKVAAETDADVVVWIDFGIFHLPNVDENVLNRFFRHISARTGTRGHPVEMAGCWPQGKFEIQSDKPYWRFCGGVIVCRKDVASSLDESVKTAFSTCLSTNNLCMWEVNTWALAETLGLIQVRQYHADHNETMFTNYLGDPSPP